MKKNILLATLTSSLTLFSMPQGQEVISGEAHSQLIHSDHLQIKASDKAILHWKNFSIEKGQHVQFLQPSSKAAVLNRVKGSDPSSLLGMLSGNGKVYLINPNGIVFGKEALIQTADFIASTLDITDKAFLSGYNGLKI